MPERTKDLKFLLNDGTEVETSFLPPHSIAEQIAFEEHFKCSYVVIDQAVQAMRQTALRSAFTVRCSTCNPPVAGAATSEQGAEIMRSEHLTEKPGHELTIEPPEELDSRVDPTDAFRVTWILWFGFHRARAEGKVAAKFSTFLQQLADWSFETPEEESEPQSEAAQLAPEQPPVDPSVEGEDAGSLDPMVPDPLPVS